MPKKPIMAPDGGYLLDGDDFVITKDELGRPVISVVGGAKGDFLLWLLFKLRELLNLPRLLPLL